MSKKKFIKDYVFWGFIFCWVSAIFVVGFSSYNLFEVKIRFLENIKNEIVRYSVQIAVITMIVTPVIALLSHIANKFISKYLIGNDTEKKKYLDLIQGAHFDRETRFNELKKQKKEEDKFLDVENDKEFQKLDREVLKNYLQFYKYYENKKICEELKKKLDNYECVSSEDLLEFIDEKIYF